MQAALLVRAGVGTTLLVDRDYVEESNLQRQVLFDERDAERGVPKAEAAALALRRANSAVTVVPVVKDLVRCQRGTAAGVGRRDSRRD